MAEFGRQENFTAVAAADLSRKQYHFVRLSGADTKINQASEAAHSSLVGVLQNKPQTEEFANVAYAGLSKVVAGGAIPVNAIITTNGSGRAVQVASGQMAAGRALDAAGGDGEVITALIWHPVRWGGAA
jgi:hypothetical protein